MPFFRLAFALMRLASTANPSPPTRPSRMQHAGLSQRAPQEIDLAETAMPVLREGGMIGHIAVEPEPAEPPVGQIKVDLFAEKPLGAHTEAVPDDEHADQQLRINRWPSQRAVERRELAAQFRQVDKAVDRPQQMIRRHMFI